MITHADTVAVRERPGTPAPRSAGRPVDDLLQLSAALTPQWQVAREIDYLGEVSFLALPNEDDPEIPAFILYQKAGQTHVATIHQDDWENDLAFATSQQAVNAMIARATTLGIGRTLR
jgi:hypothetical protein